ncbi:MAG: succinate dehydrogenase assembly factor 2 [Rhodospirillales bacterium]|nr:succinate dehydrogenase assembly factor 2 [Rhodospirillales bacterium]
MDDKRKRLLFHCTHMGMKENDVMFGDFARAHVAELSDAEVSDLEALLKNNDLDLYNWVLGHTAVPPQWNSGVLKRLQMFNAGRAS